MAIVTNIKIDILGQRVKYAPITLSSGDKNAYALELEFYKGTEPFDITGYSLSVIGKPKGALTPIPDIGEVKEGKGYYLIKPSMYQNQGELELEIILTDQHGMFFVAGVLVFTVRGGLSAGYQLNEDEKDLTVLRDLIQKSQAAIYSALSSAEYAKIQADMVSGTKMPSEKAYGDYYSISQFEPKVWYRLDGQDEVLGINLTNEESYTEGLLVIFSQSDGNYTKYSGYCFLGAHIYTTALTVDSHETEFSMQNLTWRQVSGDYTDILDKKVDKVAGKGLSTNDYTNQEKEKLSQISPGATKAEKSSINGNIKINGVETTVYTLPSNIPEEHLSQNSSNPVVSTKSGCILALGDVQKNTGARSLVIEGRTIEEPCKNLIPDESLNFIMGWESDENSVVTISQNQTVAEWDSNTATRIQINNGGSLVKYKFNGGVFTKKGCKYNYKLKIKNNNSQSPVIVTTAYETIELIQPNAYKIIDWSYVETMDDVYLELAFKVQNASDYIDIYVEDPQIYAYSEKSADNPYKPIGVGESGNIRTIVKTPNLISNADFSNGTTNWKIGGGVLSVENGWLKAYHSLTISTSTVVYQDLSMSIPAQTKLFARIKMKVTHTNSRNIQLYLVGTDEAGTDTRLTFETNSSTLEAGKEYVLYGKITTSKDFAKISYRAQQVFDSGDIALGSTLYIKDCLLINMGSNESNPLYNLTADEMNAKYPDFIPYGEAVYETTLSAPLYALSDSKKDYVDITEGKIYKIANKIVCNGSESWSLSSTQPSNSTLAGFGLTVSDISTKAQGFYSHGEWFGENMNASRPEGAGVTNTQIVVHIAKARMQGWDDSMTNTQKVDLFKNYLLQQYENNTPITFIYELQAEQIENITNNNISLFAPASNVTTTDALKPNIIIKYNQDINKVVEDLKHTNFSSEEKLKLAGITDNATRVESSTINGNIKINGSEVTVYTHPNTAGNKHLPSGGSSNQFVKYSSNGTGTWSYVYASDIVTTTSKTFVSESEKAIWNAKQDALGFIPENPANKGKALGYAPLDEDTKIPIQYIPELNLTADKIKAEGLAYADFTGTIWDEYIGDGIYVRYVDIDNVNSPSEAHLKSIYFTIRGPLVNKNLSFVKFYKTYEDVLLDGNLVWEKVNAFLVCDMSTGKCKLADFYFYYTNPSVLGSLEKIKSSIGKPYGIAPLNSEGKLPSSFLEKGREEFYCHLGNTNLLINNNTPKFIESISLSSQGNVLDIRAADVPTGFSFKLLNESDEDVTIFYFGNRTVTVSIGEVIEFIKLYTGWYYTFEARYPSTSFEYISNKNKPNGYAGLDENGKISISLLPVELVNSSNNTLDLSSYTFLAYGDDLSSDSENVKSYVTLLNEQYNFEAVNNYSQKDICLTNALEGKQGGVNFVCENLENQGPADIITMCFGVNDWYHSVPLGNIDDEGPDTFYGAYNKLINEAKSKNPYADIILLTPTYRSKSKKGSGKPPFYKNGQGLYLFDYVEAVKKLSEFHGVYCIDLFKELGIRESNKKFYTTDGFHLNQLAHKKIAKLIGNTLSKSILLKEKNL